ncbi:MAG: Kelch repeat-containing protein [Candidatus Kariarchaeaceae archaeon]
MKKNEFAGFLFILALLLTTNKTGGETFEISWTKTNSTGPEVAGVELIYDTESDKSLLFAGWDKSSNPLHKSWVYDYASNTWTDKTNSGQPETRIGYGGVYDTLNDLIILYGGFKECLDQHEVSVCYTWDDTYSYDIDTNDWINKSSAIKPPPLAFMGMTYDKESKKVIMFGGYSDELVSKGETWAYDFETNLWENMEPLTSPSARWSTSLTYDTESDRAVLFGGIDTFGNRRYPIGYLNDTWAYDYNTNNWTQMFPNISPTPQSSYGHITYVHSIDKIVLYGGKSGPNDPSEYPYHLDESWAYDYNNNTWVELSNNRQNQGTKLMYNSHTDSLFIFDEENYETWEGKIQLDLETTNKSDSPMFYFTIIGILTILSRYDRKK